MLLKIWKDVGKRFHQNLHQFLEGSGEKIFADWKYYNNCLQCCKYIQS